MLAEFLKDRQEHWWNEFFSDRNRNCPFFLFDLPDENLVEYFDMGTLKPGCVLELGCGFGRNARFFEKRGCRVDAVDFSGTAITWAKEKSLAKSMINYIQSSIFDLCLEQSSYDIVYDCGCFHYIPPHRRQSYLDLILHSMKPNAYFALVCFTPEGGSGLSDIEVSFGSCL